MRGAMNRLPTPMVQRMSKLDKQIQDLLEENHKLRHGSDGLARLKELEAKIAELEARHKPTDGGSDLSESSKTGSIEVSC